MNTQRLPTFAPGTCPAFARARSSSGCSFRKAAASVSVSVCIGHLGQQQRKLGQKPGRETFTRQGFDSHVSIATFDGMHQGDELAPLFLEMRQRAPIVDACRLDGGFERTGRSGQGREAGIRPGEIPAWLRQYLPAQHPVRAAQFEFEAIPRVIGFAQLLALLVTPEHLAGGSTADIVGAALVGVVPIADEGGFRLAAIVAGEAVAQVLTTQAVGIPYLAAVVVMGEIEAADSRAAGFAPGCHGVPVGDTGAAVGIQAQVGGVALMGAVPGEQAEPSQIGALVVATPPFVRPDEGLDGE